jgi:hypothetical protein
LIGPQSLILGTLFLLFLDCESRVLNPMYWERSGKLRFIRMHFALMF